MRFTPPFGVNIFVAQAVFKQPVGVIYQGVMPFIWLSIAVLLLIMQASDAPLLVDQPEDDLDNRFIYDDVVKRLRAAKSHRQFVVATHNANIPVLGDAEQIVVATDCGMKYLPRAAAEGKMRAMSEAAAQLRAEASG